MNNSKSNNIIYEYDQMAEVLLKNYHLLPVINRFGINLGFGDATVSDVCQTHNIDTDFFLIIINTFHNENYFPEQKMQSFNPLKVVNYLQKTHEYYLNIILPRMEMILENLINSCSKNCEKMELIKKFYHKYKQELLSHIKDEEDNVFPYIKELITNRKNISGYSIHTFEKEHSNVDMKLNDLTMLFLKYLDPIYDSTYCNDFLIMLLRFEKDLKNHARIEDYVLVPAIESIEKNIRQ